MKKFIAILTFTGLTLVPMSCRKAETGEGGGRAVLPPVAVNLVAVVERGLQVEETVVGTIRPRLEATVAAKIAGRILELHVAPGQRVAAGEPLATLESGELQAAKARAVAALDQANRERDRQRQLMAGNATARVQLEQAEAAQRIAEAGLAEITATLDQAVVKAPFAGIIARKLADTGDFALPGKGIVQLEDPTQLRLETPVPETLARKLRLGDRIPVDTDIDARAIVGTICEIAPSADTVTRTFLVKMDLPADVGARAGMFARARFPLGERKAVVVPAVAVRRTGQIESVFVHRDGKAVLLLVRTAAAGADGREVRAGLSAGEQLICPPPPALADGQAVLAAPSHP